MGTPSWRIQIHQALNTIDHTPTLHRRRSCAVHVSGTRHTKPSRNKIGYRI